MSQSQSVTLYTVSGNIGNAQQQDNLNIQLSSASGMTDAVILAIAEALNGITWPAGVTGSVYASKVIQTNVVSAGNLSAAPPEFV